MSGPTHNNNHKLVVGIDFGTTFSGIAWAHTDSLRPDRRVWIDDWPSSRSTHGGVTSSKVPTLLRYLGNNRIEWGFQIPHDVQPREVLSLFKLGLEPDRFQRPVDDIGKSLNLENVDRNITDYLSGIFGHFVHIIHSQIGRSIFENSSVQFVLTVPAIWSENAKQRTLEAFERVPNLPSIHSTSLLSEPEAAAIAAIQELVRTDLKIDDSFVVVDAGGGTVDLITYTITNLHPLLEVVEATAGTGDICGSSRINDRFAQLLTARFENEEDWNEELLHDAVEYFERRTKKVFNMGSLTQHEQFSMPMSGLGRNPTLGINRRGRLSLRAEELHMLFEPEILRTIQLVKEQIALTSVPIRKILLVGGFGSSMYLKERLQIAINEDASISNDIEILQPPNAWVSVVNGAVLKGLSLVRPTNFDVPVVKARTGRKHYGHEWGEIYKASQHLSLHSKRYWDGKNGTWRVPVMNWIIKRGDLVSEDQPFITRYTLGQPVSWGRFNSLTCTVYADQSSDVAPLARNDNVQVLCRVTADLRNIPEAQMERKMGVDGIMYYDLHVQLEAVYRSASTEYALIYKGQRYQTVTAEYV
ncbi:hypothetical protein F4821DRAFT_273888 [Hypoxylon rubiginosum]|uniref:Uncharacterized protein n=1 Tax=Hypoxylon rubiginosum TaxID=110542 RepID=A0ACC0CJ25_9PEZI|nr:hypothetical protein F4821DRAFT_273888 [Hypoxylon rubiginosum]